jgi:inosine-uridine nucleoside N-ribohydrolase
MKPANRNILTCLLLLLSFLCLSTKLYSSEKIRLIIDADTANEVDDLYAIIRCLVDPAFEVIGLCSAHWQVSHWATPNTLEDSQRLNVMLLSFLNKTSIPHPRGAPSRLYDWGQDVARHSAAAYFIIKEAHKMPAGEKLKVAVLGASTNIASALLIDPTITGKIEVFLLGTSYDFAKEVWKKADFNCLNDIHAIDVLLDAAELELFIMPTNTAAAMRFKMAELKSRFAGKNDLLDFLYKRWVNHIDGGRYSRTIWDLSIIEALVHPEWATKVLVTTPPENTRRQVYVYSEIEAESMIADFYKTIADYFELD